MKPRRDEIDLRVGDGFGDIGKKLQPFRRATLEVPFGVAREQTAGFGEGGFVMQAGEDVEHFALRFGRVADAIGGDERQLQTAREFDGGLIARFFLAIEWRCSSTYTLSGPKMRDQALERFPVWFTRERAFFASGEAEQAFGEFSQIFGGGGGFVAGLRILVPARIFMRVIRRQRF